MKKQLSLQELTKIWYKKIDGYKGFKDIEDENGNFWVGRPNYPRVDNNRQEYYRLASQCLWDKKFPTPFHKKVWKLHCDGLSQRAIAELLLVSRMVVRCRLKDCEKLFDLAHITS